MMQPPEYAPHRTETQRTAVHPCAHPRCDDGYGNRRLTTQTMCDPCRNHYRKQLDWLVLDYVTIKATLPAPTGLPVNRSGIPANGRPTGLRSSPKSSTNTRTHYAKPSR